MTTRLERFLLLRGELRRRREAGERGVALIEAAIVLPLVVLIFLGLVEFGFAWRDVNRIERALQAGGRVASGIGRGRYADFEAIRAIDSALEGITGATLERIIVFEASGTDGRVPAACASMAIHPATMVAHGSAAAGARCNVYSRAQAGTQSPVGFPGTSTSCSSGSWDSFFCPPTNRTDTGLALTYVGVYIRAEYEPFTSVIDGPTLSIERTTVYRVEPCVPAVQTCT
jgi:hypothetical protein